MNECRSLTIPINYHLFWNWILELNFGIEFWNWMSRFETTGKCDGSQCSEQCMLNSDAESGHPVPVSHLSEAPSQRREPADQLGRPDQHLHVGVQGQCHVDDRLLSQRGRAQAYPLVPARVPHKERPSPLRQNDRKLNHQLLPSCWTTRSNECTIDSCLVCYWLTIRFVHFPGAS